MNTPVADQAVAIFRVDMPAAPDLGYPEAGSAFFVSLDGERFYPTDTDPTHAALPALQAFWDSCQVTEPDHEGVRHGVIAASRRYLRLLRWPVTELRWERPEAQP
jgi:hypothetical protein